MLGDDSLFAYRFRCLDNDANGGNMRPIPPGHDGVDYCKIRRDRTHNHHGGVGGTSSGGGTLRRSSASTAALLEPPSPAERYHGTIEGHYRVHDLALDRYVPPPSPERYSSSASGTTSAGRSYHQHHHHHHQQQQQQQQQHHNHHHHQPSTPDDRYTSLSCHGTTGSGSAGSGNGSGGGGRSHYLPISQSTSESFMSPPSPVAERFEYVARHHDSYATAATKRNESVYSR